MPTKMVGEITDLVKPHYDRGKQEGKNEGRLEGKLESARNLLKLGVDLKTVLKATGLKKSDLVKAGILER